MRLNEEIAKALQNTILPKKYLPWEIDEKGVPNLFPKETDMWNTYNLLTANIWHNEKSDMKSKFLYFNALHQVLASKIPISVQATQRRS